MANLTWTLASLAALLVAGLATGSDGDQSDRRLDDFEEETRIIHGQEAEEGHYTYQASIQWLPWDRSQSFSGNDLHFCGGTIVAPNWIVTAAHCAMDQKAEDMQVMVGGHFLSDETNPVYDVEELIVHDYDDTSKIGDIALIRLSENPSNPESRLEDHPVVPIPLCPRDMDATGQYCTITGWGHTKSKGSTVPEGLMKTDVMIVSKDGCFEMYAHENRNYPWDDEGETMICAGGYDKDACQGDSGGPLVCPIADADGYESLCLYGITSWGIGCATKGYPGAYTNVRHYEPWVWETLAKYEDKSFRLPGEPDEWRSEDID